MLDGFSLSRQQAEDLILASRVKVGWIEESALAPEPEDGEGEGGTAPDAGTPSGDETTLGASN